MIHKVITSNLRYTYNKVRYDFYSKPKKKEKKERRENILRDKLYLPKIVTSNTIKLHYRGANEAEWF